MVGNPQLAPTIAPKIVIMVDDGVMKTVRGRPTQYDQKPVTKDLRGQNGEFIVATLYESQCPFCAKPLSFAGNLKAISCPHCKRGTDQLEREEFVDPFCEPGDFDRLGIGL